ncbi:hypothetical protein B0H10DRAFT_1846034, partial [Mycena sp. CBHHK59/15]
VHPKYKTAYFAKAKWPREWIKTAEDLVRYEWETHYKPQTKKKTAEPNVRCQLLIPSEHYTVHTGTENNEQIFRCFDRLRARG